MNKISEFLANAIVFMVFMVGIPVLIAYVSYLIFFK